MIAYALEADPLLLPHIPELLADLEELGSDAELIARVVGGLEIPGGATVVDLGCGKGAVAVEMAQALGLQVLGIELFEPFARSCIELAGRRGVSHLCRFVQGDVLKLSGKVGPFDVAVCAALGDVLGRLDETIGVIRRYVKPGGFIVISDAFIKEGGSSDFRGFEHYAKHAETVRRLTSHGDELVREARESDDQAADDDEEDEAELILARARALAERHPEIGPSLLGFADQSRENDSIDANLVGAVWVLRRA